MAMQTSVYKEFCQAVNLQPAQQLPAVMRFSDREQLAELDQTECLSTALFALINLLEQEDEQVASIDRSLIDELISRIDIQLNTHLDNILHNAEFQQLESLWCSVQYLVDRTDFRSNIKLELLDISKHALQEDFDKSDELQQTGLYKHIYEQEYDMPGGEPITALISDYSFTASNEDIDLLENIAKSCQWTHCTFIGSTSPQFFAKEYYSDVLAIDDMKNYLERAEYIRWNNFRTQDAARHIGLTMPKFLLRLPYQQPRSIKHFQFRETTQHQEDYLWGAASFAFAANMVESFKEYGWTVNIRGPESGGRVDNLPLPQFEFGQGRHSKIPTQALIPETREVELAELGFIPLSYYKNSNHACFFSANSLHKAAEYLDDAITSNSRINGRLPYVLLVSRIAHYLKVLQRENIGTSKTATELENELNTWLKTLVTKMRNPDQDLAAKYPLSAGQVKVTMQADNPGYFNVDLLIQPHFQLEGVDVKLSLVAQFPANKNRL